METLVADLKRGGSGNLSEVRVFRVIVGVSFCRWRKPMEEGKEGPGVMGVGQDCPPRDASDLPDPGRGLIFATEADPAAVPELLQGRLLSVRLWAAGR